MQFKTNRYEIEFDALNKKNPALTDLLSRIDNYSQVHFGKEITVTDIYRTKDEQNELYSYLPVDKRPAWSPHMVWCAVDLRSKDFTEPQIKEITDWINSQNLDNLYSKTALYHKITNQQFHFHIQLKVKTL